MAIQLPNPGLGDGQTGDNEYVMWTKVKDNFSNTDHAASRLVGTAAGNVVEMTSEGVAGTGWGAASINQQSDGDLVPRNMRSGIYVFRDSGTAAPPNMGQYDRLCLVMRRHTASTGNAIWFPYGTGSTGNIVIEQFSGSIRNFYTLYSDKNTTKDSNGMIKASSPVLRVFSDRIEGNDDGEKMGAEFVKKGVGDYLIKGTTGLADEGWYVTVPQDANGNNLVAVEYESLENGDVALRTYKRRFDFETVSIVADRDNPLDIPETRWVDLRFNDIAQEQLDEPIE